MVTAHDGEKIHWTKGIQSDHEPSGGIKLFSTVAVSSCSPPSSQKPIILLDVDGVINFTLYDYLDDVQKSIWTDVISTKIPHPEAHPTSTLRYPVTYSPTVVNKINEWSTKSDIVWLTSWKRDASIMYRPNTIYVVPFGLPSCLRAEHLAFVDKYLANPELVRGQYVYQCPEGRRWEHVRIKTFTSGPELPPSDATE